MPILENGDVIPHFLGSEVTRPWSGGFLDETKLLRGEVKEIIYPNDDRSRSKRSIEYIVVAQRKSNGTDLAQEFRCVMSNPLGAVADKLRITLRRDENQQTQSKEAVGKGAKVLFLCINGEKHRGVILGGVKDDLDEADKDVDQQGHHLYFVFNGVVFEVNDDGEPTLKYTGKTDVDGKTQAQKAGSSFGFDKDGHVVIKHVEGVLTGDASDHTLLGESFRQAQKQMNQQLKAQLDALQKLLLQVATQLNSAVSTAPGAPLPQVVAAGGIMQGAAQVVQQMSQTVDSFEQSAAQKNSFLSQKNKSD